MTAQEPLTGRVALVTGGDRGIGAAIALAFAQAGCDVAISYREREEEANRVRARIEARGRRAAIYRVDAAHREELRALPARVEGDLGAIGVLCNNAGIGVKRESTNVSEDDWDSHLAVNLTAPFVLTQAVLPAMRAKKWGRIINVGSLAARTGGIIGPHYAASKAGLEGLTHGFASRLVRDGITVNAIAPALIETEMVEGANADLIPLGRMGTPEEVAEVAVLLARNAYVTGQTVHVNGGAYMT